MTLVEQYRRDGFVVLHNAVELPLRLWGCVVEEWLSEEYDISPEAFRAEARLIAKETAVMDLFLSTDIQDVVNALGIVNPIMQTSPVMHAMGFDKSFDGTHAHQDWPALQSSLNAITVWIPLHDVGVDNYPLEVVPGSHRLGLLPAKVGEHYSEVDTAGMEFVPVPVPVGGALLFSAFTVHRTRTPGVGKRVAFSHRYEDAADPWFLDHDYYCAQKRVIDREVKYAPSVEEVRAAIT